MREMAHVQLCEPLVYSIDGQDSLIYGRLGNWGAEATLDDRWLPD